MELILYVNVSGHINEVALSAIKLKGGDFYYKNVDIKIQITTNHVDSKIHITTNHVDSKIHITTDIIDIKIHITRADLLLLVLGGKVNLGPLK